MRFLIIIIFEAVTDSHAYSIVWRLYVYINKTIPNVTAEVVHALVAPEGGKTFCSPPSLYEFFKYKTSNLIPTLKLRFI